MADGLMPTEDGCNVSAAVTAHAADLMDTTITVSKQTCSPSSSSGEVKEHKAKSSKTNSCSFASTAGRAVPPHQPESLQTYNPKFIIIRSAEGSRCFIHPDKVAIYSSIYFKKYIEKTLIITGGGRGIRFEVVSLDNLPQSLELVTKLGEFSVKCWLASHLHVWEDIPCTPRNVD